MRQYSIPALAEIPDRESRQAVSRRAAADPQRWSRCAAPAAPGSWQDVTIGEFRDEVTALAKGLIAAGNRRPATGSA